MLLLVRIVERTAATFIDRISFQIGDLCLGDESVAVKKDTHTDTPDVPPKYLTFDKSISEALLLPGRRQKV